MSALSDVRRVVGLWGGRAPSLLAGAGLSVAAVLCGVGLIAASGRVAAGGALAVGGAAALLRVLGLGRIVLRYGERLLTHDATFRALADLRVWFFRQVAASAAGGLGFRRSGDLLSRLVADVDALDALYLRIFVPLVGAVVLMPCVVVVLWRVPGLAAVVAVLLVAAALLLPALAARFSFGAGRALTRAEGALRVSVVDAVAGARELRVFGAEGRVLAEMQGREARLIASQLGLARRVAAADAGAFLLGQAGVLAVLVAVAFGALGAGAGGAGFAAVAVFLVLASFEAASGMPRAGVLAGHAAAAARRVVEAADARPVAAGVAAGCDGGAVSGRSGSAAAAAGRGGADVPASGDAAVSGRGGSAVGRGGRTGPAGGEAALSGRGGQAATGREEASGMRGAAVPGSSAIRFENVSFGWAAGRPVLRGMTMEIAPGARVALLGPSGAGKSTVAQLLLGVARPDEGRITLGGVDLAALPAELVRHRIALLSQATHLFADTIRANLLIGNRGASEARMWAALDAAAVGDWVRGLPDGLDTWLGEGGATVSGGQGRRLALARTLLSEASVLVLDEPASGLDGETERAFLSTLFSADETRTIVLIAHRLTGAERLDRIWRMQGGRAAAAAA